VETDIAYTLDVAYGLLPTLGVAYSGVYLRLCFRLFFLYLAYIDSRFPTTFHNHDQSHATH